MCSKEATGRICSTAAFYLFYNGDSTEAGDIIDDNDNIGWLIFTEGESLYDDSELSKEVFANVDVSTIEGGFVFEGQGLNLKITVRFEGETVNVATVLNYYHSQADFVISSGFSLNFITPPDMVSMSTVSTQERDLILTIDDASPSDSDSTITLLSYFKGTSLGSGVVDDLAFSLYHIAADGTTETDLTTAIIDAAEGL